MIDRSIPNDEWERLVDAAQAARLAAAAQTAAQIDASLARLRAARPDHVLSAGRCTCGADLRRSRSSRVWLTCSAPSGADCFTVTRVDVVIP